MHLTPPAPVSWLLSVVVLALALACGSGDATRGRPSGGASGDGSAGAGEGAAGAPEGLDADNAPTTSGEGDTAVGPPVPQADGDMPIRDDCGGLSVEAEAVLLPTDVVWAIDTSGSMTASFPAIQQALNDFSTKVVNAGIDAHIVLLAGAAPALGGATGLCVPPPLGSGSCGPAGTLGGSAPDSNEPTFLHLDVGFGANQGMGVLLDNHASYAHMLRPGARTQLVLTEDGVPPMTAQAVIDHIEGRASATLTPPWNPPLQPGDWVFNGVICSSGGTSTCLLALLPPTTTLELIDQSGGLLSNLDDASNPATPDPFAELLDELAEAVIVGARLGCEYAIPPPPAGETLDPSLVNVRFTGGDQSETTFPRLADGLECADNEAWTYDDPASPTQVLLCPAACGRASADIAARIDVTFGCETEILRPD